MNNILSGDFDYIWKSNIHKVMCLSLENHTYSFCDKNMCPLFVDKQNLRVEKNIKDYGEYRQMEEYPKVVALGYDPSCNLACSTCRQKVYFAKDKEKEKIELITEKVIANYLSHADFLILAGDGEVFASPSYKEIYTSVKCNPLYLRLLTNGTLFNKKIGKN